MCPGYQSNIRSKSQRWSSQGHKVQNIFQAMEWPRGFALYRVPIKCCSRLHVLQYSDTTIAYLQWPVLQLLPVTERRVNIGNDGNNQRSSALYPFRCIPKKPARRENRLDRSSRRAAVSFRRAGLHHDGVEGYMAAAIIRLFGGFIMGDAVARITFDVKIRGVWICKIFGSPTIHNSVYGSTNTLRLPGFMSTDPLESFCRIH